MSVLVTISAEFIYGFTHLFGSYSCKEAFRWGFRIKSVRVLMCTYMFLRGIELSQCLLCVPKGAFNATDNVWISWNVSLQDFQLIIVCDDALVCRVPRCCAVLSVPPEQCWTCPGWCCRVRKQQMLCAMAVQEAVQLQSQLRMPAEQCQCPQVPVQWHGTGCSSWPWWGVGLLF